MLSYAIFTVLVLAISATPVVYKDCGSVKGSINSIDVSSCATEPCQFRRGTNISVTINFKANEAVTGATTVVHGIIAGVRVPFPVPSDACKNMACPIASGASVSYTNVVFVQPVYPEIQLVVQWEVKDQAGNDLVCFVIPVQITS
ncbi:NPC intracellular cholesterol transporter 2 [Patella vulgata]|uniref:NPC intracellular cholesterol transporter 2 n=1 Tax=Patella vulgata TaxID=6465 RepID=UPI0021807FFE|nr:NPC intracellular cholesterol transporter 2 [Patella vulgata]